MITRARMLIDAESLVFDSEDMLKRIMALTPDREPTARIVFNDAVRVHMLLSTSLPLRCIGAEVKARLVRATLLTDALNRGLQ